MMRDWVFSHPDWEVEEAVAAYIERNNWLPYTIDDTGNVKLHASLYIDDMRGVVIDRVEQTLYPWSFKEDPILVAGESFHMFERSVSLQPGDTLSFKITVEVL